MFEFFTQATADQQLMMILVGLLVSVATAMAVCAIGMVLNGEL